jgi:hypothetical protein
MYTHISTDIRFDDTIEINKEKEKEKEKEKDKDKKKEITDDFTGEEIKLNIEESIQTNTIITDEESVKMINDIIERNDDKSVHNNTPISTNSRGAVFNEETQITDENVYDNFKHISQSCDNLLSKDNIDITTANNDLNNTENKVVTEISDISDDVSVMSEFIIDEPENTNTPVVATTSLEKPKPTRGRKKKN